MNKKLLVAAVGSIVLAGAAQAQTHVTLYGKIDEALQITNSPNGRVSNLTGSESGTRWGLRGSEDLGGGMSAIFQLESGFNGDNGSVQGNLFNRISTVGLKGGFGTVELGLKDTPLFNVLDMADPFGSSTTASVNYTLWLALNNGRGYTRRLSNQIAYTSPNFSGFYFQGMYALGENNGQAIVNGVNEDRGDTVGLSLIYANGPAYVAYAYNRQKVDASFGTGPLAGVVTGVTPHKYQALAGSYDLGVVKLYGTYYTDKQNSSTLSNQIDQRVYSLGLTAPVGAMSSVGFSYGRVNDKLAVDRDARQFGLGYFYNLSKRTYLYTTYGNITNKNFAGTGFSTGGSVNTLNASGKASSADFGVVHKF